MKWQYKGEWFESIPIDWEEIYKAKYTLNERLSKWNPILIPWENNPNIKDILVYVPKYDKCYTIQSLGIMGNGNKIKMCLEDIYNNKLIYVMAKDVELVIKCKYEN